MGHPVVVGAGRRSKCKSKSNRRSPPRRAGFRLLVRRGGLVTQDDSYCGVGRRSECNCKGNCKNRSRSFDSLRSLRMTPLLVGEGKASTKATGKARAKAKAKANGKAGLRHGGQAFDSSSAAADSSLRMTVLWVGGGKATATAKATATLRVGGLRCYFPVPSVMVTMRSTPGTVKCSSLPLGQWISMSSILVAGPRPKWGRGSLVER